MVDLFGCFFSVLIAFAYDIVSAETSSDIIVTRPTRKKFAKELLRKLFENLVIVSWLGTQATAVFPPVLLFLYKLTKLVSRYICFTYFDQFTKVNKEVLICLLFLYVVCNSSLWII